MNRILRSREVTKLIGISRTQVWKLVHAGQFPQPVRLGGPDTRSVGWHENEIQDWLDTRARVA